MTRRWFIFFIHVNNFERTFLEKMTRGPESCCCLIWYVDNMTISVNKTNWNLLVSIISLDLFFYSLDFDLNIYLWARNVTGTLQKQQSSSQILKHPCDFSLPIVDLDLQSFQCSKIRSAQHWGRRAAHFCENKGVKRECKKFGENSTQMAPVSTIWDEYWGLRRKWWSCKWRLDENESDSGCKFTYIVIVFKIITERDYQACRFWICQDWQRRSGYTTIHSLLRVTSGKYKITQNDLVLLQF